MNAISNTGSDSAPIAGISGEHGVVDADERYGDRLDAEFAAYSDSATERDALKAKGVLPSPRKRSKKRQAHSLTRIIHVYTSMVCFLVVLFFSVTGLTLNHPTWSLGSSGSRTSISGTFPSNWKSGTTIDWLRAAEFLRSKHALRGEVAEHDADERSGTITFKGPGYSADAFFQVKTGTYDLTVEAQGFLGMMNDLHKGRDSKSSWRWLIDASAVFLIVISLTGLALQFFLRKRRRSALLSALIGSVVLVLFAVIALQ
jgi:uncharacterized protein